MTLYSLRRWCPVCQLATVSKTCGICGAEMCAGCSDHGADQCDPDDDE